MCVLGQLNWLAAYEQPVNEASYKYKLVDAVRACSSIHKV